MAQGDFVAVASRYGFSFHHAEGQQATLFLGLDPSKESRVPMFASHQVGVSGRSLEIEWYLMSPLLLLFLSDFEWLIKMILIMVKHFIRRECMHIFSILIEQANRVDFRVNCS